MLFGVRRGGLEPPQREPLPPQSSVYTNFTTCAYNKMYILLFYYRYFINNSNILFLSFLQK